ncbi:MAG: Rrf2 family transcriptional regulator [candidate division WOR-3 bacterium]
MRNMVIRDRARLFHVSEAANLALHAMAVLAGSGDRAVRTREIADNLQVSAAHLAKVMAMLERAGLVTGTRGPCGGYRLTRPGAGVTLAEIYEAIEGPLGAGTCIFGIPICNGSRCPLGKYFSQVNRNAAAKLRKTRLSEINLTGRAKHGKKA